MATDRRKQTCLAESPPTPDGIRRHADGSIDYGYYESRALRCRSRAFRTWVRRIVTAASRTLSLALNRRLPGGGNIRPRVIETAKRV